MVICVWTPSQHRDIAARWFDGDHRLLFGLIALGAVGAVAGVQRTLRRRHSHQPFIWTLALIFLGYLALAISVWPKIVPPYIDIWQASSPATSQLFALIGTLFILPIILTYTVWSYYVFRGKVRVGDGYH